MFFMVREEIWCCYISKHLGMLGIF
jgi:hypothetical protein